MSKAFSAVKTVDFGPFLNGSQAERQRVAREVVESFREIGFVVLVNHGIPQHQIDGMFALSKQFFDQPMEIKQLAPRPSKGSHFAGYASREHKRDPDVEVFPKGGVQVEPGKGHVKEAFGLWREDHPTIQNIWYPEGVLTGFKETCMDFFWSCDRAKTNILRALALGLDIPEDYLTSIHNKADNLLRMLHYLSIPSEVLADAAESRFPRHSDWGSITLLMQDDVGGLEVENPSVPGEFVPVSYVPGSIVVNAGDFLMRWSNDIIPSTIHRVRAPTNLSGIMIPERYSIPYFCFPDFDAVIDCIPGTWSDERPKRYGPISAKEYITSRLEAAYY